MLGSGIARILKLSSIDISILSTFWEIAEKNNFAKQTKCGGICQLIGFSLDSIFFFLFTLVISCVSNRKILYYALPCSQVHTPVSVRESAFEAWKQVSWEHFVH